MSSKTIVGLLEYQEKAYRRDSLLPNVNPRCPQLLVSKYHFGLI